MTPNAIRLAVLFAFCGSWRNTPAGRIECRFRKEHAGTVFRRTGDEFERVETLSCNDDVPASLHEKVRADCIAVKTAYDQVSAELKDMRLAASFGGCVGEVFCDRYPDMGALQSAMTFVDIFRLRIEPFITQYVVMRAGGLHRVSLMFDDRPDEVFSAASLHRVA